MRLRGLCLATIGAVLLAGVAGCGDDIFLISLTIAPDASIILEGETQQFTVTGTLNNSTTITTVPDVEWESSDTGVATINATSGLATCVTVGTTTITATAPVIPGAIATVSDTTTLECGIIE